MEIENEKVFVIFIGYAFNVHKEGIIKLSRGHDKIYILYDDKNDYYKDEARKNAIELNELLKLHNTELIGFDPQNYEKIMEVLTYIYKKEENKKIYIDISNTSKEVNMTAIKFAKYFGSNIYSSIFRKEKRSFQLRINEVFNKLRDKEEVYSGVNVVIENEISKSDYIKMLNYIEIEYLKYTKESMRTRSSDILDIIESGITKPLITENDEIILEKLYDEGIIDSITSLSEMTNLSESSLNYRIKKLTEYGIIDTKIEKGKIMMNLNEYGKGIILGIIRARGNNTK